MDEKLISSLLKLEQYIRRNRYKGYDRYDGLEASFFKNRFLRNKKVRFIAQQIIKRSPFNIRPLLLIPKGYNPVTLGLCLQAYTYMLQLFPEKKKDILSETQFLLNEIIRLQSNGYSGSCWGYDFDWETRYASIPAYMPTVVATGIITNALFEFYRHTNNQTAFELCESATHFVLNDLNRTSFDDTFCFSYSPVDKQVVFNATMKGARLLAQVYSITSIEELKQTARQTIDFVTKHQQNNGAWAYAQGDARQWVDNYHTAYILDALYDYIRYTGDKKYENYMKNGLDYYVNHFFWKNRIPKLFPNKIFPIDSTAVAQSIITLTGFGYLDIAENIVNWVIEHFQAKDGHIYFRKYRYVTSTVSFMRWSNAWMYLAFARYLVERSGNN